MHAKTVRIQKKQLTAEIADEILQQIFSWVETRFLERKEVKISYIFCRLNNNEIFNKLLREKHKQDKDAIRRDMKLKIIEEIKRRNLTKRILEDVFLYKYNCSYYLFLSDSASYACY